LAGKLTLDPGLANKHYKEKALYPGATSFSQTSFCQNWKTEAFPKAFSQKMGIIGLPILSLKSLSNVT